MKLDDITRREFLRLCACGIGAVPTIDLTSESKPSNQLQIQPDIRVDRLRYKTNVLVDNTTEIGDLTLKRVPNQLFCVQKNKFDSWIISEFVNEKLEERCKVVSDSGRVKIGWDFSNHVVLYTDYTPAYFSINFYELPITKESRPAKVITGLKDVYGWIVDMDLDENGRICITSSTGKYYRVNYWKGSIEEVKGSEGVIRFGRNYGKDGFKCCLLMGIHDTSNIYTEFLIAHFLKDSVELAITGKLKDYVRTRLFKPAEEVGGGVFIYKDAAYNNLAKKFLLLGTMLSADMEKKRDIATDYIFEIDPVSAKGVPIVQTERGKGFSIKGLDIDGKGDVYFSSTDSQNRGKIVRLSR